MTCIVLQNIETRSTWSAWVGRNGLDVPVALRTFGEAKGSWWYCGPALEWVYGEDPGGGA